MSYLEKKEDRIMVKKGHQFVFVSLNRYILGKFLMPFFVLFQNHFLFHFLTKDFINGIQSRVFLWKTLIYTNTFLQYFLILVIFRYVISNQKKGTKRTVISRSVDKCLLILLQINGKPFFAILVSRLITSVFNFDEQRGSRGVRTK